MKAGLSPQAIALVLCCGLAWPALAHEGHDAHDDEAVPAARALVQGPQRQADGAVFLPKPAQRQMGLRTQRVSPAQLPRVVRLKGSVVLDPNAGGRVQAMVAGRLEAGPQGFPSLGQVVRKGQILAWLQPASGALERASQAAQWAELQAAAELAKKRLGRLRELADTVPRRDIEAAESELQSLQARSLALRGGLQAREALRAPANGRIAAAPAFAGQVVEARELLFEVLDPQRLQVEALAYDPALAGDVAGASLSLAGQSVALDFVGAGLSLRDQALPLIFKLSGPGKGAGTDTGTGKRKGQGQAAAAPQLLLGQVLELQLRTRQLIAGMAVPAAALQRNAANQTVVWVKTAPERFEPRVVQTQALDGEQVAVTAGLQAGERVVSEAAALLHQIR